MPAVLKKWEYKKVTASDLSEAELNELGNEGWEFISKDPSHAGLFVFTFKRPKTDDVPSAIPTKLPEASDELIDALVVEQIIKTQVGAWSVCNCDCHHNPNKLHMMACCWPCPDCGQNIKGDVQAHQKQEHPEQPECARGKIVTPMPHPGFGI